MTGFLGPFSFDAIESYILSLFCIFYCDFRGGIGDSHDLDVIIASLAIILY